MQVIIQITETFPTTKSNKNPIIMDILNLDRVLDTFTRQDFNLIYEIVVSIWTTVSNMRLSTACFLYSEIGLMSVAGMMCNQIVNWTWMVEFT